MTLDCVCGICCLSTTDVAVDGILVVTASSLPCLWALQIVLRSDDVSDIDGIVSSVLEDNVTVLIEFCFELFDASKR